jgi:hypothetical protein
MRTYIIYLGCFFILTVALSLSGLGCEGQAPPPAETVKPQEEVKKIQAGKNVHLEIKGKTRRVLVEAKVCLREGPLEQLLTRARTKEHEAILSAEVDGRDIHKALLVAGATAGSPVQFYPKFRPPQGSTIKVFVQWEDDKGQLRTEPANKWILNERTMKDLDQDWVFAGSQLFPDPDKVKPDYYLANDGDLICVANFPDALLDLPMKSSSQNAERSFVAHTKRIPPRDTKVVVILEPVPDAKEAGKEGK